MTVAPVVRSLPELVANVHRLRLCNRIFEVRRHHAPAVVSPELELKYGSKASQEVVSIRNRFEETAVFYNPERSRKPQNFVRTHKEGQATSSTRSAGGGAGCDFCDFQRLTAVDTFGRIEGEHVTTASNLFKYIGPYQAVSFLKHRHDLLDFSLAEFQDYLNVGARWFRAAEADWRQRGGDVGDLSPMILWNGGERSGASQRHSHMQLLLSACGFPEQARQVKLTRQYNALHGDYVSDLVAAHGEVGLAHTFESASVFASLCPLKSRDIMVVGSNGVEDRAFQRLLFCGLRTLIDELGSSSFNMGIYCVEDPDSKVEGLTGGRIIGRIVSRGQDGSTSLASDFGGLEVFGGASIGADTPWSVKAALDRQLEELELCA
jgi:hypothetical protein